MIGNLLGGRYELRGKLGHGGGVGEAYEAWDGILGRRVAVRLLDERTVDDPKLVARFLREGQASAWLTHPNVVAIHDGGRVGDVHFIVKEHVDGRTLAELLRDGPFLPERAAAIASDVCLALDHAHRQGVVHRDLNPGSILVTARGEVKVTDFRGTEPAGRPRPQGGEVVGAPECLAPEQAAGGPVDGRADLYALGCCLYEMLTGTPPFGRVGDTDGGETLTAATIALAHLRASPVPPHRRRPDVPAALDRVVMRALAKRPDARQQGAEELRRDLERFSRRPAPVPPVVAPAHQPARVEPAPVGPKPAPGAPPRALAGGAGGAAPMPAAVPGPAAAARTAPQARATGASARAPQGGAEAATLPGAALPVLRETAPVPARAPAAPPAAIPPFRRRLAAIIALVAVTVLAAGGTIAALTPDVPAGRDGAVAVAPEDETVLPTTEVPSSEAPTTTAPSTTTSTTAPTTTAPATSRPATTRASGSPLVTVPRVVGQELSAAVAELSRRRLGTRVQSVPTRRRSQVGEVVSQDPKQGAKVPQGTTVTLVVAMWLDRGSQG